MCEEKRRVPTLYLVGTPIGNLQDMTYRAVAVLKTVPLIAAEDTRHTRELLTHFDIHTRLTSYHEHNKAAKGAELIAFMAEGNDLACVTDAGLPGISDPGSDLAARAIAAGFSVSPVPGANAALSALIASGLDTRRFSFVGFLPRQKKKRTELLQGIKDYEETLLFYEAPHHLRETLAALCDVLGPRLMAAGRELTKRYEAFHRGTIPELIAYFADTPPRGEFVLVVAGRDETADEAEFHEKSPMEVYEANLAAGVAKKEAMRLVAKALGLSRRDIYKLVLAQKQGKAP